jgi:hypothetical protein
MHALVGAIPTCEAFILCRVSAFASDAVGADRFCRAQVEMRGPRMHGGLQSALRLAIVAGDSTFCFGGIFGGTFLRSEAI